MASIGYYNFPPLMSLREYRTNPIIASVSVQDEWLGKVRIG